MSDYDAYQDDMERISRLSDREIDRLLAGKAPSDDGELEELAAFMQDVGTLFQEPPADETAAQHLTVIAEATRLLRESETSAAARASSVDRERSGHTRFRLRSKPMRAKLLVASAGLLLVMAFGGAAYAGALPGPVQGTVADIVGNVGVTLPGDEVDDGDQNDVDDGDVGNVDESDHGDIDDGQQGDVDDGPQGDVDEGDQGDDDQGQQEDADEGDQGDDDQGQQEDADEGDQGGQGDGDQGSQGDDDKGSQGDDDKGSQGDDDQGEDG